MAELQTPAPEDAQPSAPAPVSNVTKQNKQKKQQRKKLIKRIISLVLILALVGGAVFGVYKLVFAKPPVQYLEDVVQQGTIQEKLEGYGYPRAQNSSTITLATGGTVLEVYVNVGDFVTEGTPLYSIDSSDAQQDVTDKQRAYDNEVKILNGLYEAEQNLIVHPPFNGKLLDVASIEVGQDVSSDFTLGTLVDDSKMKLSLYFSYAYENEIYVGQTATVSIPSAMGAPTATVEKINKVNYITPEGSQCFEVVLSMDNPGTLTAGMGATAILKSSAGEDIYPYNSGTLAYNRTLELKTEVGGEALEVNLINYNQVTTSDVLLHMSGDDNDEKIANQEKAVATALENLTKAQENLANFNAVAPISGTVMSCSLVAGEKVGENTSAITIADNGVMTVDIQVDERQIAYVKSGMSIELSDWNNNVYMGTVTSVGLTPNTDGGATTFPVTVEVDNSGGTLMTGTTLTYSFVAKESVDCLMVPIQAVKYITDAEGNPQTVVFIKADTRPENAVDTDALAESDPSAAIPKSSDGFYAVPVETGISDTYNVEIISGLELGQTIFTDVLTNSGDSYGGSGGVIMIG